MHNNKLDRDLRNIFGTEELSEYDKDLKILLVWAYEKVETIQSADNSWKSFTKMYLGLLAIFCLLIGDIAFWFLKIPFVYHGIFLVAIACNFLIVFLKKRREKMKTVESVMSDWSSLPEHGRDQFMQAIRTEISQKISASGINSRAMKYILYWFEALSLGFFIKVISDDRAFSLRAFFILLLSLVLFVIVRTVLSSQGESSLRHAKDDHTLLRLYHRKLTQTHSQLRLFLIVIAGMMIISVFWYFFWDTLSHIWKGILW